MPEWLSDMVPDYISSSTLLCPLDSKGSSPRVPDPHISCSYGYQFSPAILRGSNLPYREVKAQELKEYGDIVPAVRCYHHARHLNLSYGGDVYLSPGGWPDPADRVPLKDHLDALRASMGAVAPDSSDKSGDTP